MPLDKREPEQLIAQLLKAFDDLGALKERDEFLNFRRRLRLYASCTEEPYLAHMRDTVERLPKYSAWLLAAEQWSAANLCDRLHDLLEGMVPQPMFTSLQDEG